MTPEEMRKAVSAGVLDAVERIGLIILAFWIIDKIPWELVVGTFFLAVAPFFQ